MTVGKAGSRRPVATGCSAAPAKPSKPSGRTPVATGCGSSSASTGWKAKTRLSERSASQLEKAKTTKGGKTTVSTGCGTSTPSKPAKPAKPTRTGC